MIGKKEKYTIVKPEVKIIRVIKAEDPKLFKAFSKHAENCDTASGLIRQAENPKEDISDKIGNVKHNEMREYKAPDTTVKTGAYFSGKSTGFQSQEKSSFEYHKPGVMTCGCGMEVGKDNNAVSNKSESKNVYGVSTQSNQSYGDIKNKQKSYK